MNTSYESYDSDKELDSLYAAITGRRAFSYNAASDPLYRSYADRYIQNGRLAMRDTMGQAAALTGGYGSSYAQGVGQQRYDEYLRGLSEALPQLYTMAYKQYADQGQALQDAYGMARQRREDAYRRERDAADDAADADQLAYARQRDSYQQLYQLIAKSGYLPSDGELAAAGMTRAQAEALRQEYLRSITPKTRSGGGRSSGSSKKKKDKTQQTAQSVTAANARGSGAGMGTGPVSRVSQHLT